MGSTCSVVCRQGLCQVPDPAGCRHADGEYMQPCLRPRARRHPSSCSCASAACIAKARNAMGDGGTARAARVRQHPSRRLAVADDWPTRATYSGQPMFLPSGFSLWPSRPYQPFRKYGVAACRHSASNAPLFVARGAWWHLSTAAIQRLSHSIGAEASIGFLPPSSGLCAHDPLRTIVYVRSTLYPGR